MRSLGSMKGLSLESVGYAVENHEISIILPVMCPRVD
jgi:hypothetical protein